MSNRSAARLGLAVAALFVCASAQAQAPYMFPVYRDAAQIAADCERMLGDLKTLQGRLETEAGDGTVSPLATADQLTRRYEDTLGPMQLLNAVHPDKAIRDATEDCTLKYDAFNTALFQNPKIHALVQQVKPADEIDRRFQRDLLDAFEDAGVALPAAQQQRAKDINQALTRLQQEFERRVREDKTKVPFTLAELKGVPKAVYEKAPRDAQGRVLLGLEYPSSIPVIEQAVNPAARERMWLAFQKRAGAENLKTLAQIVDLRREYAGLFGFPSYADFVLRRRMAENEGNVLRFLDSVHDAVTKRELDDLAILRDAKAHDLKRPLASTVLNRWDAGYYTQRVRKARFQVDQESFRPYFPPEASLQVMFHLAGRLFGVRFEPQQQTLWHPDAKAFLVVDEKTRKPIGTFYADLYPRADKYNHAAVWSFRGVSTLADRQPAAALVTNFSRQGLTLEELETMLHEFGHALHSLLSSTRYASQGGTNTQLDFVEAPSQMLEEWVFDPQVLALYKEVCPSCKPVPDKMLAQAADARHFAKGVQYARQHLYASYDMALYGKQRNDPMDLWSRMEAATPLGHVQGTMVPASFGHVAGGYAAGYYGYLWSLVVAEDMRTAFKGHKLDPEVGRRYRETVLANGGQVAPAELVKRFLGRPFDSKAFFDFLAKDRETR